MIAYTFTVSTGHVVVKLQVKKVFPEAVKLRGTKVEREGTPTPESGDGLVLNPERYSNIYPN
jgi:hypothetical protein